MPRRQAPTAQPQIQRSRHHNQKLNDLIQIVDEVVEAGGENVEIVEEVDRRDNGDRQKPREEQDRGHYEPEPLATNHRDGQGPRQPVSE